VTSRVVVGVLGAVVVDRGGRDDVVVAVSESEASQTV